MDKVFVLGSLNMDFTISVDKMPELGETIQGNGFQTSPGGKGANQAVALAKQGIDVYMIGSVGDDLIGKDMKASLNRYHVHCDYIDEIKSESSGVAFIVLENNDNRIMTSAGANGIHDIYRIKELLNINAQKYDYLLAQLEIPLNIIETSFKLAKNKGMKTVLNAAPIKVLPESILLNTDLLIINQTEGERLVGCPMNDSPIDVFLRELLKLGPKEIILTVGVHGSYYISKQIIYHIPAFNVDEIVDTTGAGDAYIGCFLASVIQGLDIPKAMTRASACGALTIQKKGVHHVIPSHKMIDEYMKLRIIK